MELIVAQLALSAAAVWTWTWLIVVLGRVLPTTMYVQQNLGVSTPRLFYRLVRARRWLTAGGVVVIGVAFLMPEMRTASLLGMFLVSAGSLTYAYSGSAKLLHPRVVNAVLSRLRGQGPEEPPPVAA